MSANDSSTDSFFSYWGGAKNQLKFDNDVSSPTKVRLDRKRNYIADADSERCSSQIDHKSIRCFSDVEPDTKNDISQPDRDGCKPMAVPDLEKEIFSFDSSSGASENMDYSIASIRASKNVHLAKPEELFKDLSEENKTVPSKFSRKDDFKIPDAPPGRVNGDDNQMVNTDEGTLILPPMNELIEKLAEEMKERTLKDWTEIFSNMEHFENTKKEQLLHILRAALAYEEKLKSQKAELRQFLMKLSNVFL